MTLILGATFVAGLLITKLLLALHVDDLRTRYIIAVCAAYLVFLAAIKLWLAYVGDHARRIPVSWGDAELTVDALNLGAGDPSPSLDLDDGWLLVLVLAIAAAAIYVVYAAPLILSEAAFEAALAAALARRANRISTAGWVGSVVRATLLPFAVVLIFAAATGWYAQKRCPGATRLRDAVRCATAR